MVEVIANQMATALELLATEVGQIREPVIQIDYILVSEGGVCGKFNFTHCYLQIDDNHEARMDTAKGIRKVAKALEQKCENMRGDWSW